MAGAGGSCCAEVDDSADMPGSLCGAPGWPGVVAYTLGLFEKKESKPQEESLSLPYDTQSEQQPETQEPEQQPVEQEPVQQEPQPQEPETKPDPVQEPEQQPDAQEPAQQEPEQQPDEQEPEQQPEDQ